MIVCPQCRSELVAQDISPERRLRCADCGYVFASPETNVSQQRTPNRAAWWSLGLGISSILLFFITGVPALLLGVWSLIKMRRQQPTRGEKNAGVIGTFLGAVFGVVLGGCLFAGGGLIAYGLWTLETSLDPVRIKQMMAEVVHIDLPDGFEPRTGAKVLKSQTLLVFEDFEMHRPFTSTLRIIDMPTSLSYNLQQLRTLLLSDSDFPYSLNLNKTDSETLVWVVNEQPTEVVHETYSARLTAEFEDLIDLNPNTQFHRYHGVSTDKEGAVGICLVLEEPGRKKDPVNVRQLFESLKTIRP